MFGEVEEVSAEGVTGEYAFITGSISEQDLKEKTSKLADVLSTIRVRF
jgi:Trm5-related predicted tRNA methylase